MFTRMIDIATFVITLIIALVITNNLISFLLPYIHHSYYCAG